MRPPTPWARFDDMRGGGAQFFRTTVHELVATRPEHVAEVLAEVDRVTRQGSWAYGFVSYEAAAGLDPTHVVHEPVDGLPLAWFGVCPSPESVPVVVPRAQRSYRVGEWRYQWGPDEHRRRLESVRRLIAAGETYQCNLTTRLSADVDGDLFQLYGDMAHGQGSSYNAFLDLGRFVIASASPELFFKISGDRLLMRPMKGTAPRGRTPAEDAEMVGALQASAKERAENIMIVDLVRNDVAQLAVTGGVAVTSLCRAERYETVYQLTSEVVAQLRPDVDLVDVFRALFPCGSVTGAPKARTMELIRDLEDGPRGVYCGAIGVVAPPDQPVRARFNVAIRTTVADRSTGIATYGTGGGITWDSRPASEYAELQAKAALLTT
ncbi:MULTISPECIES: aminodeoxychorismate synthase component I [unclassified Mycobacterium]|uniref:aminodeoxychorismate synthase component I n=1 Tax=unclassified Mycobacterium TaxID=2642494 RepID=UPI0029C82001|nr:MULTISPECIES: aminodeoxychorismate synthase component I [unclassified Mycobacterium]